jgi:5-methylthioadenosine/S-adenosylhomocysteine deaminase
MKTIIENGITFSPTSFEVQPINVLIDDGIISKVSATALPADPGTQVYNVQGRLIIPGFVDSHTHLAQSFGRGIYDNVHLTLWLTYLTHFFDLSPEETYYAVLIGCVEALRTGTTCVAEMTVQGEQGETTLQAIADSGLRAVVCTTMGDYQEGENPAPDMTTSQALEAAEKTFKNWHGKADGRITMRISPVGLPACTEELMCGSRALANQLGVGLHTHCCEGETETANSHERFGISEVEVLQRCGVLGPDTQLVHCIWLSERDRELIAETGSHVITCPSTNTKVTDGMPPMPPLHQLGVNIGIGCDGEASSGSYDMLQEARLASLLGKISSNDAAMFPAETTFQMMTRNGSRAIGLGDQVGVLEPGRKADITVIDYPQVHLIDERRLLSNLIYSATGSDVDSVFVAGKLLFWRGKFTHIDEEAITAHALQLMRKATHLVPSDRSIRKGGKRRK